MINTQPDILHLQAPDLERLGEDHVEFLSILKQPTWITIEGVDNSRSRAIVTLLHGNEPSGLKAIHQLLVNDFRQGRRPATRLGILVAAVDAALAPPVLSHRYLPHEHDLNRCFSENSQVAEGQRRLTQNILQLLHEFQPEAVIDTHNTSSHSQPFCVAVQDTESIKRLASFFAPTLAILDQKLGTLMEHTRDDMLIVTVEFGSLMDPNADALAYQTLRQFVQASQLSDLAKDELHCLIHPLRLETQRQLKVAYSSSVNHAADLTMINTLDRLNFQPLEAGITLGWFKQGAEHRHLVARTASGMDRFDACFSQANGILKTRIPMTIFMATTDSTVANNDCLLYFMPASSTA